MHRLHKHRHLFHIVPTLIIAAIFVFNYTHTFAAYYYASQFGTEGSGDGQFSAPKHIAQDPSGNLYIVDNGNNRIQKFDSNGVYISQFSSFGTGDGELQQPNGIKVHDNHIYVADGANSRIQKFDMSGNYVSQFGTYGAGDGELWTPFDVALDPSGNAYVADYTNSRIEKFNSDGTWNSHFIGSGSATGTVQNPFSIEVYEGHVYISEGTRIQKFDMSGNYVSHFGEYGEGVEYFVQIEGFAFDADDNIYTVDDSMHRIQKFDNNGNFLEVFGGPGTASGRLSSPVDLVINAAGEILVTDQNMHRVQRFSTSAQAPLEPINVTATALNAAATVSFTEPNSDGGSVILYYTVTSNPGNISTTTPGTSTTIYGLTNGVSYNFYVTATNAIGTSATTTTTAAVTPKDPSIFGYEYSFQIGTPSSYQETPIDGEFDFPRKVIVNNLGDVIVVDGAGHSRVQKFDASGNFISKFGTVGFGNGEFDRPIGIAIDGNNNMLVVDKGNNRVQVFNSSGVYVSQFGTYGGGDAEFDGPEGITIDQNNGDIYITDTGNSRVVKYNSDYEYVFKFGIYGSGQGEFNFPRAAIKHGSFIFVSDSYNHRIQKFDLSGNYVSAFGTEGTGNGQFNFPGDLMFDSNNNLFVVDTNNSRIQKFDSDGNFIADYGSNGSGPGFFNGPEGLWLDSNNNIFVVDRINHIVQKLIPLSDIPETVATAPQNVVATAGNATATISFTAPSSDGGSTILYYSITSTPGNIFATTTYVGSTTVAGLTNDTVYTFVVTATNAVGVGATSSPSNAVTPTGPVTPPETTPGNGSNTNCPKGAFTDLSKCTCPNGTEPVAVAMTDAVPPAVLYECRAGNILPIISPNIRPNPLPMPPDIAKIIDPLVWQEDAQLQDILLKNSLFIKNYKFKKNLSIGMTNVDVKALQIFLNIKGLTLTKTGYGSIGRETNYFGNATRQALIRFQQANKIYPANGYFGPVTRELVNKILEIKN